MNLKLSLKKPLFYLLLPVLIVLAFAGFPIPIAPSLRTKAAQEQSVTADQQVRNHRG